MKRFVRFALLVGAIGVSFWFSGGNVAAASNGSWLTDGVVIAQPSKVAELSYIATTCPSDISLVAVEGWAVLREACVFGYSSGTQVARYIGSSGLYLYAIKFPLDTKFTPIKGLCLHASFCAYGQASNTFLMQVQQSNGFSTALISDFTQYLVRYSDEGVYFRFEYQGELPYITNGSRPARTNAVSVSSNGKWAFAEVQSYGYVRVNLDTLEQKRVVAPGPQYGYGTDPTIELAISDDGTKVAIAGWRMSIAVYEVNDLCGDVLTDLSLMYYSPYTYACPAASIDVYSLFPGFVSAHVPRFSHDGSRLSVHVRIGTTIKKATIAPVELVAMPTSSYLAFGDSFTSGEGELSDDFYVPETNTDDNRCHVSTRSYPYLLKQRWGGAVSNRACSGSRIAQVNQASSIASAETQPKDRPSRISVSVGGNDIELMGKLKTCIGPGTCEWATSEKRSASREEIRSLFPEIVTMLQKMEREYPGTDIAVIGYPSVVNTTDGATCRPLVSALLNSEERLFMEESIKYLNSVLRAATMYTKTTYVDIKNALVGERLCDTVETAMNSVRLGDDIAPIPLLNTIKFIGAESFHPTPRGHELITTTIQDMLAGTWWMSDDCARCEFSDSQLAASSYWDSADDEANSLSPQKSIAFLSRNTIKSGASVPFRFLPGSFAPGATIQFSLHSDPYELGSFAADADGGLRGDLAIPDDIEGYHTVHAVGPLPSGQVIDSYETLAVQDTQAPIPGPAAVIPKSPGGDDMGLGGRKGVASEASILAHSVDHSSDSHRVVATTIPLLAPSEEGSVEVGERYAADALNPTSERHDSASKQHVLSANALVSTRHSLFFVMATAGVVVGTLMAIMILRKRKRSQTIEAKHP